MSGLALLIALAAIADEAPEIKTSLPTKSDEAWWRDPGFRVAIGYSLSGMIGVGGAPSGPVHAGLLRLGVRLDDDWSLIVALSYGVRQSAFPGLRYSGTIEPTLHLTPALTISAGLGLGGFVIPDTGQRTPEPEGGVVATYTVPSSRPLLGACSGAGVVAVIRVEYLFILAAEIAAGPSLQVDAQWTRCVESLDRSDPDTGEAIELRQYWQHHSVGLAWSFWWR